MTPERYRGKPFLRLIDCYVLEVIGQLDPQQRETLKNLEPQLRQVYNESGTWQQVVRAQTELPPQEKILEAWQEWKRKGREHVSILTPAESFVIQLVGS